jgi:serine protease AprX
MLRSEFAVLPLPLRTDADPRFTGRGVVIAFIDSGFFPHPELEKRILAFVDVTDDAFGDRYFRRPHAESWHGTMSAVLACGSGSLSDQVYSGVAYDARIICVKVLNTKTGRISSKDIARGIRWVIDHREQYGIDIINIAVGGDKPQTLAESEPDLLVEEAVTAGMVAVVAVGNSPDRPILPPASAQSAISVGGYDDHDLLDRSGWSIYHSTYGKTPDGVSKPELLGPATLLPGPLLPGTDQAEDARALFAILRASEKSAHEIYERVRSFLIEKPRRTDRLKTWARKRILAAKYITAHRKKMEGSSVAAGVVTSVTAQMLEAHPGLKPAGVRSILLESAVPLTGVPPEKQGAGTLNPRQAVRLALRSRHTAMPGSQKQNTGLRALRYRNSSARTVSLAGDFNNWDPDADPCQEIDDGVWSCLIEEPPGGRSRYKLVVDRTTWVHDPEARSLEPDGFGGWNSNFGDPSNGEQPPSTQEP